MVYGTQAYVIRDIAIIPLMWFLGYNRLHLFMGHYDPFDDTLPLYKGTDTPYASTPHHNRCPHFCAYLLPKRLELVVVMMEKLDLRSHDLFITRPLGGMGASGHLDAYANPRGRSPAS
jgi:hypothetical protein